jgi:hypothetical protein
MPCPSCRRQSSAGPEATPRRPPRTLATNQPKSLSCCAARCGLCACLCRALVQNPRRRSPCLRVCVCTASAPLACMYAAQAGTPNRAPMARHVAAGVPRLSPKPSAMQLKTTMPSQSRNPKIPARLPGPLLARVHVRLRTQSTGKGARALALCTVPVWAAGRASKT